jgi:hypothetical protein
MCYAIRTRWLMHSATLHVTERLLFSGVEELHQHSGGLGCSLRAVWAALCQVLCTYVLLWLSTQLYTHSCLHSNQWHREATSNMLAPGRRH